MLGNAVVKRFLFNNVTVGAVGAVTNVIVNVTVPAGTVAVGDKGFGIPSMAAMVSGMQPIVPCEATTATNVAMCFANASAGSLTPAATLDYEVYMFARTGNFTTV